jgi:hypothetical protein
LLAIAGVDASDTEIHTQLFGEPCLGDTALLQMLLDKVYYTLSSVPLDDCFSLLLIAKL